MSVAELTRWANGDATRVGKRGPQEPLPCLAASSIKARVSERITSRCCVSPKQFLPTKLFLFAEPWAICQTTGCQAKPVDPSEASCADTRLTKGRERSTQSSAVLAPETQKQKQTKLLVEQGIARITLSYLHDL